MQKIPLAIALIVIASFVLSGYYYPRMQESVVTHWNISGEPDGYSGKLFGLFLVPVLLLILCVFLYYIPHIDPLRANVAKFRKYYDRFILLFAAFMFYVHAIVVLWNLGYEFNFGQAVVPAFSALFYYVGVLVKNAKMNWFIGIRTPWTLSSEKVWDKTHKTGGDMFRAFGIASLVGIFIPEAAFGIIIGGAVAVAVWAFVYSYSEFRKENSAKIKIKKKSK